MLNGEESSSSSRIASSSAWISGLSRFPGAAFAARREGAALGGGNVAKHKLGQLFRFAALPVIHDIVHAAVDLRACFVRQIGVYHTLVKAQLAPVAGDFQHIIYGGVNISAMYLAGALREQLHHLLLGFRGLGGYGVVLHLRGGKVERFAVLMSATSRNRYISSGRLKTLQTGCGRGSWCPPGYPAR